MASEDPPPSVPEVAPPPIGLSDPPTRSEVLAYLDWEIQNTREQAKIFGASPWTLTLALGAVLWLLLSKASYSWAELPPVLYLIGGFSLLQDALGVIYYSSREKVPEPTFVRRMIRLTALVGSRRRQFLFWFLRYLFLLLTVTLLPAYVMQAVRFMLRAWCVFLMLVLLAGFLMGSLDVEVPVPQAPSKKVKARIFLLGILLWAFSILLTVLYWLPVISQRITFAGEDYTAALLVVVAVFLASLILESQVRAEIGPTLISLRRDLALGTLQPEDAAQHASYVVSGLSSDAYAQRELLQHEKLLKVAGDALTKIRKNLAELEAKMVSGATLDSEKVRGYLASLAPALGFADRLEMSAKSFRKKLEPLTDTDARRRYELKAAPLEEICRTLCAEMKSCVRRIEEMVDRPNPHPTGLP